MDFTSCLLIMALVVGIALDSHGAVVEHKVQPIKVFNYQGALPPIKDDRTGEIIKGDSNDTTTVTTLISDDAEACWNLIVERSIVTFALQNRVLNELQTDMDGLSMEKSFREALDKLSDKLKNSMKKALDALKEESAEDYFDALFDTSENIIQLSSMIRDPKLDDKVFAALAKAVTRLGRNNSALITEFIDECSINERSPQPRNALNLSARS